MKMDTQDVLINEYNFGVGDHSIKIEMNFIHSLFIVSGSLVYNSSTIENGTFMKISDIAEINFTALEPVKIFEIISPKMPNYKTYSQMR